MTPNAAPLPSVRLHPGAQAADRRRSPAAFRGSLERRLPASTLTTEVECLLPPVGRSEAFAEDLLDEADAAAGADTRRLHRPRLRWLGLPVLTLGVAVSLSLSLGLSGMAGMVGF